MRYLDIDAVRVAEELAKLGGASVILATAPNSKAMSDYIDGFGVGCKLLAVGASADPISVTLIQRIMNRRSIQGWPSGSGQDSEDTLNLFVLAGIHLMIETFPLERSDADYDRILSNKARFRVVLTMNQTETLAVLNGSFWTGIQLFPALRIFQVPFGKDFSRFLRPDCL